MTPQAWRPVPGVGTRSLAAQSLPPLQTSKTKVIFTEGLGASEVSGGAGEARFVIEAGCIGCWSRIGKGGAWLLSHWRPLLILRIAIVERGTSSFQNINNAAIDQRIFD
jgi:hypothetical protein